QKNRQRKRRKKGIKEGEEQKQNTERIVEPFSKKECCQGTSHVPTQGTRVTSDGLKGQALKVRLADLKNCFTNFHSMELTHDRMCSMAKKWQIMIEAHVNVKTISGFFCAISAYQPDLPGPHQKVHQIYKMMEIMIHGVEINDLKEWLTRKSRRLSNLSTLCMTCMSTRSNLHSLLKHYEKSISKEIPLDPKLFLPGLHAEKYNYNKNELTLINFSLLNVRKKPLRSNITHEIKQDISNLPLKRVTR
uniref:Uncharacterized protein n=1 Tax=Amphilophus citrinellus TaxID=61819 RepID=A0A3Q0R5A0_AMPCI